MVKADVRRDYYADLELPPAATENEIKKQFKKLALKYHPDRNPGKEAEFITKFQAIQSANEVLTDPTQRAKYDADRIRSGLFYSYASPTRPNVPPRSPAATNFPPPPRPPPPTATKTSYPTPPSGTNRYTQYAKAEAPNTRTNANVDDNQTKANAFKAWEQMRHGTGPPPTSRVPPRATRPAFPNRPAPNGAADDSAPPRRTAYEQFQESQTAPRMSRANTTRVPKTGFVAGAYAGDETTTPRKPTFDKSPRSERPSRPNSNFAMPPPPGRRKNVPAYQFKPPTGLDGHLGNSDRISTPYATAGGEKTYFSSHGLGRPTSGERRGSADRYDTDPNSRDASRSRHPSTPTERQHRSASPKLRSPKQRVPVSSSSSSTSSSDEANSFTGRPFGTRRKPLRKPTERQRRPNLRPSVNVETVPDAAGSPSSQAGFRKSRVDETPSQQDSENSKSDQPEGFLQHRLKRESLRMDPNHRRGSATHASTNTTQPQQPLQRPKSWNEKYGPPKSGQNVGPDLRPPTESRTDKEPMYGNPGYSPSPSTFSRKWSEQWPFMSPRIPRTSSELPPYWAIPSILPPKGQPRLQKVSEEHDPSYSAKDTGNGFFPDYADFTSESSFKFPDHEVKNKFDGTPPMRSHSSESINTNFTPSHWDGKFTSGKEYFAPSSSARKDDPKERVTTNPARPVPPPPPPRQEGTQVSSSAPTTSIPPISAQGPQPPKLSTEEWAQHFKPPSWAYPPPKSSSPIRGPNRKRPTRPASRVPTKRPQPASVSEAVEDAENDTGAASVESVSSRTSGDESAMDIDPVLTPPSGLSSGEHKLSAHSGRTVIEDWPKSQGPPVPPRPNGQATTEAEHIYVSDLKNVAPFAPNAEGLKDLNDLTTSLPFESKTSGNPPITLKPQLLKLPDPPKAPIAPPHSSWGRYIAQMKVYMLEWNEFNSKMLAHFTERQSNIGNTLTGDWMSTRGSQGYQQYMQGIEEDFRVREHWDVSWERHRDSMKKLGTVRETYAGKGGA